MKFLLLILLFIIAFSKPYESYAQTFGGNPHSTSWKQINTSKFRIIFQNGTDSTALRISRIINAIKIPTLTTIGPKIKKINIVLQNQTTISNGYVGLGPFRSEFYTTPPQNSFNTGSLPWTDLLSIHEYRHVQQDNNFNVGFSKVLKAIFGEEGQALANSTAIPNWFYEGDAVYNETNLSRQGRGSLPYFYNGFRSLWEEGKDYDWMKLRNGSLKDYVPNHYQLGFLLTAYGREKYGNTFWKDVTHYAASFKNPVYPFQHGIKKYSGIDYSTFRKNAFGYFKKEFKIDSTKEKNSEKRKEYLSEENPSFTETGDIVFIKSDFKNIPELVIQSAEQKQKKIRTLDNVLDNYFSYRNGSIVYSSFQPDLRWGNRNYSDIQLLDISTGHQRTITRRSKYFSPDINADGSMIVAVNESPGQSISLDLLNTKTGDLIKKIANPNNLFYTHPKFINDKNIISAVRNNEGQMSIAEINYDSNTTNNLLPFTYNLIGWPYYFKDTLYFSYSYKLNDDLLAYTFNDKKIWKIKSPTTKGLGKYNVSVNDSSIMWSTFTAEGNKIVIVAKNAVAFTEIKREDLQRITSSFGISSLSGLNSNLLYSLNPDDSLTITKYRKSFKLLNFHSLEPTIEDPLYSVSLVSENILNTLQSDVSFTYNNAEKYKKIGASATYGGFFPLLSAGYNYTFDRRQYRDSQAIYFNQSQIVGGVSVPLNFSKGRSFTFLTLGTQYVYNSSEIQKRFKSDFKGVSYSYSSNYLSFNHQIQQAQQQIFPRFAQTLNLAYATPISKFEGYQFSAKSNFYFPGILKTHSLLFNLGYLKKDTLNQINFSAAFPFSRGYEAVNFSEMTKWGINYQFPIAYPDKGFGNILYLLRIRMNLFFDETRIKDFDSRNNLFNREFRSTGSEVYFDTKWWNQANISFGVRYSYLLDNDLFGKTGHNRWEFILPVNIFNK